MRFCSLASSSKGNCNIVYTDEEILLVDMGITLKDLEEKLSRLKLDPNNIVGVLVMDLRLVGILKDYQKTVILLFEQNYVLLFL